MKKFIRKYNDIVTVPKLLLAWGEFLLGKKKRNDVIIFQSRLMDNILDLYHDLKSKSYKHGTYQAFNISDPKPRNIHKATVRDRLLHHLLYRETYQYFDNLFIHDSYSCRINKGTHKAVYRLEELSKKVSKNGSKTAWVLKCDIKKFFASINHSILKNILSKYIADKDLLWLFGQVIDSFETKGRIGCGLPLGNLTSQLLVNIYMNEFDQFVKRELKVKNYLRYADDFVLLSRDKGYLIDLKVKMERFLKNKLKLSLHREKVFLKTVYSGVDFLGWIQFNDHRVLRTVSKKRMFKKLENNYSPEAVNSYLGLIKHGNAKKLEKKIINERF